MKLRRTLVCALCLISSIIVGCRFSKDLPEVDATSITTDVVKRGAIVVQAGSLGYLRADGHGRLKAELLFPRVVADDIQLGQTVSVDTRHGIVTGKVAKIKAVRDDGVLPVVVSLSGALPKEGHEGSQVGGSIEFGRLDDVLYVGRPAFGQMNSSISMFKVDSTGKSADRVPVSLGKGSMDTIQILDGLSLGDQVIISDMSRYDNVDRIRIVR